MTYVHCHSCGWDNGDFESTKIHLSLVKYGVIETIKLTWLKQGLDSKFIDGPLERLKVHLSCLFSDLKGLFKSLFQTYKTMDDFKNKNPKKICPICGKKDLDVD